MIGVKASVSQVRFKSVIQAFQEAGISYDENNPSAIIVWHDSLKEFDLFKSLNPWQVINRIPNMYVICRKATLARIIHHIKPFFPNEFSFIPKTYILPYQRTEFCRAVNKGIKRHIVKPDNGSLGQGITIVEPKSQFMTDDSLYVAQEYIQSCHINKHKFDLRIYVLIASVSPLEIYVYRDGVARFCSDEIGENTIFSQITNVSLNKGNPEMEEMSTISKLVSDVLPLLNTDVSSIWEKIDRVIVLTILASYKYLKQAEQKQCPPIVYPRCFQILGFDILLDEMHNPHVLEVNYRPSLDYYQSRERRMKVGMIRDALRIAAPLQNVQSAVLSRKWSWEIDSWKNFMSQSIELQASIKFAKEEAEKYGKFVKVYPSNGDSQVLFDKIMNTISQLPLPIIPGI